MIYTVEIGDNHIGTEIYYLCHENDYLESLCYTDDIIYQFLNYIGSSYPEVEDIMNEIDEYGDDVEVYEAEEIINDMVTSNIEYNKTPATLDDMNNLSLIPESCIIEESDDFILYKARLSREVEINKILSEED